MFWQTGDDIPVPVQHATVVGPCHGSNHHVSVRGTRLLGHAQHSAAATGQYTRSTQLQQQVRTRTARSCSNRSGHAQHSAAATGQYTHSTQLLQQVRTSTALSCSNSSGHAQHSAAATGQGWQAS